MAVHLITGYKGSEHIQSKDARSFNTAMFGDGEFVMEIGEQLDASIINNNTVRVLDGDILMQGGHIRIETDSYEDMTIQTGKAGTNRIDLIVMTYEKNSSDGTEKAYLEVIKGTETSGTPSAPEYITGDIAAGDLKNQMPLYKVKIEGVVLSEIESMFTTIPTYKTLAEEAAATYKAKLEALQGTDILDTHEEIMANTQSLKFAGALGVKEGFNKKVNTSAIANNLTTTASGYVLDARQGKSLYEYMKKNNVTYSWTSGVAFQAGQATVCNGVLYMSICIRITKNISQSATLFTVSCSGKSLISSGFGYALGRANNGVETFVFNNGKVYCESAALDYTKGQYIAFNFVVPFAFTQ